MPQQGFSAQVSNWVTQTRQRMEAVVKTAAENVVEEVISRVPVDTGFLRASLTASLDGPQPMRDAPPVGAAPGSFPSPSAYALVIEGAQLGQTIYVSFTANYARHVEYGTKHQNPAAMVRLSAQNWPYTVEAAVRAAKAAVSARSPGSTPPSG